ERPAFLGQVVAVARFSRVAGRSPRRCAAAPRRARFFFEADAMPMKKPPHRAYRNLNLALCQPLTDLFQGEIRLVRDQLQKPSLVCRQRRALAPFLRFRLGTASSSPTANPGRRCLVARLTLGEGVWRSRLDV